MQEPDLAIGLVSCCNTASATKSQQLAFISPVERFHWRIDDRIGLSGALISLAVGWYADNQQGSTMLPLVLLLVRAKAV
jgi:hypothetical protein